MSNKDEQERKKEGWEVREIRSLVDEGIESGLSLEGTLPYTFTKWAARDLEREYKKYCKLKGSVKGFSRKKALHSFLMPFSKSSEIGQDYNLYGREVMVLDIDRLFKNCSMYYIRIEGGGIVILRILLNYS